MALINPRNLLPQLVRALIHRLWGFTRRQLESTVPLLLAVLWHQGLLSLRQKGKGTERYDHSPSVTAHSSVNQIEVPLISVFISKMGGKMQRQGSEHTIFWERAGLSSGDGAGWAALVHSSFICDPVIHQSLPEAPPAAPLNQQQALWNKVGSSGDNMKVVLNEM